MSADTLYGAFNPSSLAQHWGLNKFHVLALIRSGQLRAFNAASDPNGGRPVYRIPMEEVTRFERERITSAPPSKPRRSRKSEPAGTYY